MTDFVEVVSQGNVIVMLLFTAFVCLVLGSACRPRRTTFSSRR